MDVLQYQAVFQFHLCYDVDPINIQKEEETSRGLYTCTKIMSLFQHKIRCADRRGLCAVLHVRCHRLHPTLNAGGHNFVLLFLF